MAHRVHGVAAAVPIAAAVLMGAAGTAAAAETRPLRFGTNWVAQAEHGGYYQAVADGTYAACGLDVTIEPGGPQVNGRALLLAGRLDAYMGGNMLQPILAQGEGIPLVVVAANFQKDPQVLMTRPGRIASFEQIGSEGLTVLTDDNSFQTWYRLFVRTAGFRDEKRAPYTFNSAPFIANPDIAQQGFVTSEPYAIEREAGWAPDVWLLADHGFESYSTTIEMMRPFVEANPEAVQCFVDGSALGWVSYLYGDNAAANARIKADNPEMTDGQIAYSIEALKRHGIVDSGDALEFGINAMSAGRMQAFFDSMAAIGVVPADLPYARAFTLDFVNRGVGLDLKQRLTGR